MKVWSGLCVLHYREPLLSGDRVGKRDVSEAVVRLLWVVQVPHGQLLLTLDEPQAWQLNHRALGPGRGHEAADKQQGEAD